MNKIRLKKPPKSLTHHIPLRPDRLARFTLPIDLTAAEAKRLAVILQALVIENDELDVDPWPYSCGDDLDGDLNEDYVPIDDFLGRWQRVSGQ